MKLQLVFILIVLLTSPLLWVLPQLWRGRLMLLTTVVVFFWIAPFSALIMVIVAVLQWLLWKIEAAGFRRWQLLLSVLLPLLPLVTYKLGHKVDNWIIPLGLSYYAFRQIHVAFEYYKDQSSKLSLEAYLQYLFFLPVILIGPIHRVQEMQRSLRRQKWQPSYFSDGMERIVYGLAKIVFLGNYLFTFKVPDWADHVTSGRLKEYLKVVAFAANAYVQFSGFSDLAIGMGLLWGIRVIENFNHPFLATNMQEFWNRWHISLSSWCRDYVFQPIVGFSRNRWLALIASMLVLALWHELSWRYIAWGFFHSLLILLTITFRKKIPAASRFLNQHMFGRWLGRLWVFHLFAFSCLFIIAKNFSELAVKLNLLFR